MSLVFKAVDPVVRPWKVSDREVLGSIVEALERCADLSPSVREDPQRQRLVYVALRRFWNGDSVTAPQTRALSQLLMNSIETNLLHEKRVTSVAYLRYKVVVSQQMAAGARPLKLLRQPYCDLALFLTQAADGGIKGHH